MIGQPIEFAGSSVEMNWVHDKVSGRCFQQSIVVSAAFHLTDYYRTNDNTYKFEIIEFSGDHYFVRRVIIEGDKVKPELPYLKVGSIGSIFGCKTTVGDVPPGFIMAKKRVIKHRAVLIVIWIFIAIIVAFIAYVVFKWYQLRQQWNRLVKETIRQPYIRPERCDQSQQQTAISSPDRNRASKAMS